MTYTMNDYDRSLKTIFEKGWELADRTGVGCRVNLAHTNRFSLVDSIPLLTYRKLGWKSYLAEVLWFISGSTNINELKALGANYWDPWIDDEFTTKHGLSQGSIGYGYGHNLIHFGGDLQKIEAWKRDTSAIFSDIPKEQWSLKNIHIPASIKGFNQLDHVINMLKTNPGSRQILFTMWRPDKLDQVKLPPCHHTYHFIVSPNEQGEMKNLTCYMFQRSNDFFIGGPADIFNAAVLTYMIAQQTDLVPFELIHASSHCHIYNNTLNQVETYLNRVESLEPFDQPKLVLNKRDSIYDYTMDDFKVEGYEAYDRIKVDIAV